MVVVMGMMMVKMPLALVMTTKVVITMDDIHGGGVDVLMAIITLLMNEILKFAMS
jgi:hypothetical protein